MCKSLKEDPCNQSEQYHTPLSFKIWVPLSETWFEENRTIVLMIICVTRVSFLIRWLYPPAFSEESPSPRHPSYLRCVLWHLQWDRRGSVRPGWPWCKAEKIEDEYKKNSGGLPVGDKSPDCGVSARERGPVLPDHLPPEWQAGHHLEHWIAYNSNKADMKHIANMLDWIKETHAE